jgi:uncharacterized membrane-anchored protein YitT (DUF2179 family)
MVRTPDFINSWLLQLLRPAHGEGKIISAYRRAKALREIRISGFALLRDMLFITIGVFSAALGLKGFLLANHFIDGGATGISLLISILTGTPLYLLVLVINIPFVLLGFKLIGKRFAIKTAVAIGFLSLVVGVVNFPEVTHDNLLIAFFGGFFLGAGIGMAVRGGAVIDGTEVLAIYLSKKFGTTIGDIIIIFNIFIFSAAAYFLEPEIALYSMITYLAASKTLDFVIEGIEEYIGVTIISARPDEIREMVVNEMQKGVTIYQGKRGYLRSGAPSYDTEIIFTVITRLELNKLNAEVNRIDPNAFVVMSGVKDTIGGIIKKRPHKH